MSIENKYPLMRDDPGYPVSIILDGPTFRDELTRQPQNIKEQHGIESLRLVPGKSAASGVHGIYFVPADREWALVRLALRYRWVFEVQLNRGMSGERQLLDQGFEVADLEFIFTIVPKPPDQHSPAVYDILWLVATYDEYVLLTEAMLEEGTFTPRAILKRVNGVNQTDVGFFTKFLRSHLIERKDAVSVETRDRGTSQTSDLSINLDMRYMTTPHGESILKGILSEYTRIFVKEDLEPLVINSDLDPHRHLREYETEDSEPTPDVSLEDIRDDDGVLGEIAESFSSMVEETPEEEVEKDHDITDTKHDQEDANPVVEPETHNPKRGGQPVNTDTAPTTDVQTQETDESDNDETQPNGDTPASTEMMFGDFTRTEVLNATLAAAELITEQQVVRTRKVKEAVWMTIEVGDREKGELWELICQTLIAMGGIHGRPDGRIWASTL